MALDIGNKRAQQLRRARAAKKRKIEEDNYPPQSVLQFLDVEEERQGGDLQCPRVGCRCYLREQMGDALVNSGF